MSTNVILTIVPIIAHFILYLCKNIKKMTICQGFVLTLHDFVMKL